MIRIQSIGRVGWIPVALVGAFIAACSSAPSEDSWLDARNAGAPAGGPALGQTESTLTASDKTRIDLLRRAIDLGLGHGRRTLTGELRAELGRAGVAEAYVPSDRTALVPVEQPTCPFLSTTATGRNVECRAVVTRATVSAYANSVAVRAEHPLETAFAAVKGEAEFWVGEGYSTGVDNEATAAIHDLRVQRLCDQAPTPDQGAHEAGVAQGRQLYIDEVNKRLAEVGFSMHYPDRVTPISQCSANTSLLEPARTRALDGTSAHAITTSLCSTYQPSTPSDVAALAAADRQFATGMKDGVNAEHSLAAEAIFRVVPCNVGDPLVLDLAGDGVRLRGLTESRARFDLFGTGQQVPVAWVQGDDALLALDKNGNGIIDNGRELFGNFVGDKGFDEVESGFAHLALYDEPRNGGDGDGAITPRDAIFSELVVWRDDDGDGVSGPGELRSLKSVGITAIELNRGVFTRASWAAESLGSRSGAIVDVWLEHGRSRVF